MKCVTNKIGPWPFRVEKWKQLETLVKAHVRSCVSLRTATPATTQIGAQVIQPIQDQIGGYIR